MRNTRKLPSLAGRLERRYPGVQCTVEWHEFEPEPRCDLKGHALYELRYFAGDRVTLIEHGLATLAQFEAAHAAPAGWLSTHDSCGNHVTFYEHGGHGRPKVWEVHMLVMDYTHNDERPFTKKLQTQIARALRPFVRGTWRPVQAEGSAPH